MSNTIPIREDEERNIVPRWRDFQTTAETGELDSLRSVATDTTTTLRQDLFDEKLKDWEVNKSLVFAADLVGAASVLGREAEVVGAARFLYGSDGAPVAARSIAESILRKSGVLPEEHTSSSSVLQGFSTDRNEIRITRARVNLYPRSSLAWADLSRQYAIDGQKKRAERAMQSALSLSPDNRFILRSAARFYLHNDQPDQAHYVLRQRNRAENDPWIMAAEIAVAQEIGSQSRLLKLAERIINARQYSPSATAELASALGTVELSYGDLKKARRLYKHSLNAPTDNAVAQASWAARHHISSLEETVQVHINETPRTFEASAWERYYQGDWILSFSLFEKWFFDEPFSASPAVMASFLATAVLEKYEESQKITERALHSNPSDPSLLNNHAVALAYLGNLQEAEKALVRAFQHSADNTDQRILLPATSGLLAFRRGEIDKGRSLYEEAIKNAANNNDERMSVLALLHLAKEELLAGTDVAETVLQRALDEVKRLPAHRDLVAVCLSLPAYLEKWQKLRSAKASINKGSDRVIVTPQYRITLPESKR